MSETWNYSCLSFDCLLKSLSAAGVSTSESASAECLYLGWLAMPLPPRGWAALALYSKVDLTKWRLGPDTRPLSAEMRRRDVVDEMHEV